MRIAAPSAVLMSIAGSYIQEPVRTNSSTVPWRLRAAARCLDVSDAANRETGWTARLGVAPVV
ncbi:MAG TPA: hypothetical protein VGP27_14120 [Mycobacterium sp.]|nr:hypothetical protein [Mycobacterium sp.]